MAGVASFIIFLNSGVWKNIFHTPLFGVLI